jgi:hypothetical protein
MRSSSIAVILNTGRVTLDLNALHTMPIARVVRAELARGETASCVTATLEHEGSARDLLDVLRPWAVGNGWSITVAPLTRIG